MGDQHMGTGGIFFPLLPKMSKIGHPITVIPYVTGYLVVPEPTRAALSTPICGGNFPSGPMPFLEAFEILFIKVRSPGKKKDRAPLPASRTWPVYPANFMTVLAKPNTFYCVARDFAAIDQFVAL